jgi:NDP-sugar pyrophosphorylase family protein
MKIFLSFITIIALSLTLQADLYDSWNFQNLEDYFKIQTQYEYHQRAKNGNKENYNYTVSTTQFYIDGGLYIENAGGVQQNTNIGNYTEIEGDNNQVDQSSGTQSNENTIN